MGTGQAHTEALEKGDDDDDYDGENDDDKDTGGCHDEVPDADLEVYDYTEYEDGCSKVHEVWQVLAVKGLAEGAHLVGK